MCQIIFGLSQRAAKAASMMTADTVTPTCRTPQAELEQQPSRQRLDTPAGAATPAPPAPSGPPPGQRVKAVPLQASSKAAAAGCLGPTDQLAFSPRPGHGSTLKALHLNSSNGVMLATPTVAALWSRGAPSHPRHSAGFVCNAAFWVMQGRAVQSSHIPQAVVQECCGHARGLVVRPLRFTG